MAHFYDVGTRAWQPDTEEGWIASEVEEKKVSGEKVKLVFRLANAEVNRSYVCSELKALSLMEPKVRTVETTLAALENDGNASLPPLMNPTILEASDDLTNLSHLNEPAGKIPPLYALLTELMKMHSPASNQAAVFAERNLHIQRHRPYSHKSLCASRVTLRSRYGPGLRRQRETIASSSSFRHRGGSLCVRRLFNPDPVAVADTV